MTGIPLNSMPSDPSLTDALNLLKKDIMLNLNTHHIASIQSFNPALQTATATVNYKKTFYEMNGITGIYNPVLVDYPILIDCPVICLGGGLASLTFPILPGDECLVLFNDRDIDNWFHGGGGGPVNTGRTHSFADGIILVGLRSLTKVLQNYDAIRAVLQNGPGGLTMVGVGPVLIKIANATTTLNTLLQTLIVNIQSLVAQTAAITVTNVIPGPPGPVSGPPANAAAIAAISATLTATALQIAGLLE